MDLNATVCHGQAEQDYWSAIKGGQGKIKDSTTNRGKYYLFAHLPVDVAFRFVLAVLVLLGI